MPANLAKNHEVERIYMEQLRNIETSVYILSKRQKQTEGQIQQLRTPILKNADPYKPKFRSYIDNTFGWFLPIIIAIVIYILWEVLLSKVEILDFFISGIVIFIIPILLGVPALAGLIGIFCFISGVIDYKRAQKKYKGDLKKHKLINEQNKRTMQSNLVRANQLAEISKDIYQKYAEAETIRNDLYSINWIPNQYRNIRVVYYICDMVLSSNISIEEALKYYLLQEANNKLDEVLQKMDRIIENQNEIIMNQAVLNAQNEKLIRQNKSIIHHAASIEENTRLAAEYSEVGAKYAEANAYFSLARYLN